MLDAYTFENYIVTKNNEFAYSAAKAVVKLQGVAYNPLFIYGENRLEQTHLLYAIKNEVMKNESIKILYITYETFIANYTSNEINLKESIDVIIRLKISKILKLNLKVSWMLKWD